MTSSTEHAILRTLIYADIFRFPLTLRELHHYLIHDTGITISTIETALLESSYLKQYVIQSHGYIGLREHADNIVQRVNHDAMMQPLLKRASLYGHWLAYIPFIRMVALTGALAAGNPANPGDDFDYLLVTTPGRVWIARAFAILIVRFVRLRGDTVCPNYVLSCQQLVQKQQDVFMAREIVQMKPIFGEGIYQELRQANNWTQNLLPNADAPFQSLGFIQLSPIGRRIKALTERMLSGSWGTWLENWEYKRKAQKFAEKKTEESNALIDTQHIKGHFQDHRKAILDQYCERLSEYGLENSEYQQAGD